MILRCGGSGSSGNCYSLTDRNGKVLLIEAGIPYGKLCRFIHWNVMNIEGCIVTHSHLDHVQSVARLEIAGIPTFKPFELDEHRKKVRFGDYEITSFPLVNSAGRFVHTNGDGTECPVFGFLVKHPEMGTMVYFTDCEYCRYMFRKKDLGHILIGVNYQEQYAPMDEAKKEHVITGHMSEKTAIDFIRANTTEALQNVILCHLSEDSCNADELKANVENAVEIGVSVHVAIPGFEIELNRDCPFG